MVASVSINIPKTLSQGKKGTMPKVKCKIHNSLHKCCWKCHYFAMGEKNCCQLKAKLKINTIFDSTVNMERKEIIEDHEL